MLLISDLLELARGRQPSVPSVEAGEGRYRATTGPVIVWNVIKHCNMHCPHCYAAAITTPDPQDLSFDEGKKLLEELARIHAAAIIFSGGEPLLRRDLFQLIEYATSLGHRPQLSSNGVMINQQTAKDLAAVGIQYAGISVDGMAPFNDAYRGYEHGFERAFRAAAYCQDAGLKVGIRMTASRRNVDQVELLFDYVKRLGIPRFYVSHLVYAGRAQEDHSYDLSHGQNRKLVFRLFELADALLDQNSKTRIVTGANDADGPFLYFYVLQRYGDLAARRVLERLKARRGNTAGEKILSIDNRGNVHPDQFWAEACLGNVRHQPIEEILKNPLLSELRHREERLEGRCGSCYFKLACRGSHRERALASGGGLWSPDPSCYLSETEIQGVSGAWEKAATASQ